MLGEWDGEGLPAEAVYEAAARELEQAGEERTIGQVAGRVNRVEGGLRSVFTGAARGLGDAIPDPAATASPWRDAMIGLDSAWAAPATWHALRTTGERFTSRHYLGAVDLQRLPDGTIAKQPEERRIYLRLFWRTLLVSGSITILCLLLGYPIAHLIARAPPRRANFLLILVLVPFWTSLLVRTTAWIVLLQTQGVINDLLVAVGLVGDDGRLAMVYNMTGTIVAMTHVLLPFMVLPLYSVMRSIPQQHMNAAASLGATPLQAFPARVLAAVAPGGRGRCAPRLHPVHRVLHHAGAGGRQRRPADLQHDRVPHADFAELGSGGRAGRNPAGRGAGAVPAVRPARGHRTNGAQLRWDRTDCVNARHPGTPDARPGPGLPRGWAG